MFTNHKTKKLFKNDDPKLVYLLRNKKRFLNEIMKDEEDLLERSIRHHKNNIAEAELISYCDNVNKTNASNQSYLMTAIKYDNGYMFLKLMEQSINLDLVDNNRESALFYAIKSDNTVYYEPLITAGIDIKGFNNAGENTVIYAYNQRKSWIALKLLENKVFINHIDQHGNTILHYAVQNNDVDFALKLLELGADVFIKNYSGKSVLDIAKELKVEELIVEKINDIIRQLFEDVDHIRINELLDDNFDVDEYAHFNIPFVIAYNAVKYNSDEIFGKIIRNTDLLNSLDYRGNSLLMYCIEFNRFLMARKIIYLEVNLNLMNQDNKSVIFIVLENIIRENNKVLIEHYKSLLNELIECHVDVNIQDSQGNTVLMYAIGGKEEDLINTLINYDNIELNSANQAGKTALLLAYELKDIATVYKIILSGKAHINHMDQEQNTLLLLAMLDDDLELFSMLLHNGSDLNLQYTEGRTILMMALLMNKMSFVARIFEHPFDVDSRDYLGNSALMHAIKVNSIKTVKALLKLGADKRISDKLGNTPIYVALDLNALDIAKLLKTSETINNQ